MNKLVTVICVVSMVGFAAAQAPTSGNAFFGYSYENSKLTVDRASLNGWEGSLEGKIFPHVGIVADFSEHYGSPSSPNSFCVNNNLCGPVGLSHELDVMFGPRVSVSVSRWKPFGQILVGVAHATGATDFRNNFSFASAFGGGLDYRIARPVAWRFQGDYVRTSLYSFTQNDFRFSTGIVFRF